MGSFIAAKTDGSFKWEAPADANDLKRRLLGAFLGIVGKGQLEKWFAKTLKAIEARNYEISAAAKD